jgi:hypothetical protein
MLHQAHAGQLRALGHGSLRLVDCVRGINHGGLCSVAGLASSAWASAGTALASALASFSAGAATWRNAAGAAPRSRAAGLRIRFFRRNCGNGRDHLRVKGFFRVRAGHGKLAIHDGCSGHRCRNRGNRLNFPRPAPEAPEPSAAPLPSCAGQPPRPCATPLPSGT